MPWEAPVTTATFFPDPIIHLLCDTKEMKSIGAQVDCTKVSATPSFNSRERVAGPSSNPFTPRKPQRSTEASMTTSLPAPSRRHLIAATGALTLLAGLPTKAKDNAIRPFKIDVTDAELADLRGRILSTRSPDRETVSDQSQGVRLATMHMLAQRWATDYDWRKVEARLNALPQFVTEIDGLDIHFIHVRSRHPNSLPLIVTH